MDQAIEVFDAEVIEEPTTTLAPTEAAALMLRASAELKPKAREKVIEALNNGAPLATAARVAGTLPSVLEAALHDGEADPSGKWGQFAKDYNRARGEKQLEVIAQLIRMTKESKQPAAALGWLERTDEQWRKPTEKSGTTINIGNFTDKMRKVDSGSDRNHITGD